MTRAHPHDRGEFVSPKEQGRGEALARRKSIHPMLGTNDPRGAA